MLDNEMDKLTCSVNSKSLKHCPVEQTIAENEWHSTSDILEHDSNNFDSEEGCLISMLSLYFSRQKHYGVKKRSPFWNWCRTNSVSKVKWSKIIIFVLCHLASVLSQALNQRPSFGEQIPNVTVALGRDASLPCVVENLSNHKVAWVHIDRRMILAIHRQVVTKIPRFSVSYDSHKTWHLHISSVQQDDRGYYMCQINTEPMISQIGYLQVVVPPNILDEESSDSHIAVREHQNITLTCASSGFPTPRITWKREDGKEFSVDRRKKVNVSDGERLHLYKISRLEMGAYLCIASNGVPPIVSKRFNVDVEFTPMISIFNQLIGAPIGSNVSLECSVEAFPRAISYWVYDNMMILSTTKYHTETIETHYKTHMRLTIRNLKDKDFGKYRCLSKNSLGETEGSIRLYEIPQPSLPPKATEMRGNKEKDAGGRLIPKNDDKRNNKGRGGKNHSGKSDDSSSRNGIIVPATDEGRNGLLSSSSTEDETTFVYVPKIDSSSSTRNTGFRVFSVGLAASAALVSSFWC